MPLELSHFATFQCPAINSINITHMPRRDKLFKPKRSIPLECNEQTSPVGCVLVLGLVFTVFKLQWQDYYVLLSSS